MDPNFPSPYSDKQGYLVVKVICSTPGVTFIGQGLFFSISSRVRTENVNNGKSLILLSGS